MRYALILCLFLVACGSSSSVAPSPTPTPTPTPAPTPTPTQVSVSGTITDTVSGATIGTFSQTVTALPAAITVSAAGYITRQAMIGKSSPIVDLIRDAPPFSAIFYNQLARGTLENPIQPLYVLSQAPSFYLQTTNLSGATISRYMTAIREIVPAMTGGKFTVATIDTGAEAKPEQAGWIVIDTDPNPEHLLVNGTQACGRAYVGGSKGHVWITTGLPNGCGFGGDALAPVVLQHEIGHALGFWHIDVPGSLMNPGGPGSFQFANTRLSEGERYHAAIAYHRQSGNKDPDVDAVTSTPLTVRERIIAVD